MSEWARERERGAGRGREREGDREKGRERGRERESREIIYLNIEYLLTSLSYKPPPSPS